MVMSIRPRTYCSPFGATQPPGGGGGGGGGSPAGPVITSQPADTAVDSGVTYAFYVTATGVAPLSYNWGNWTDSGFIQLPGGTSTSWSGTATDADNGRKFRVLITDANGKWVMSNIATLTVNSTTPASAPSFTATGGVQPSNVTVTELSTATLYAVAVGNPTPTHAWQEYRGGTWQSIVPGISPWSNFAGADTHTLTMGTGNTLTLADSGRQFRCHASNNQGTADSTTATLTVQQSASNVNMCQPGLATMQMTTYAPQVDVIVSGLTQYRPTTVTASSTDNGYSYESFSAVSWDGSSATGSMARVETLWGYPSGNGDSVFSMGTFYGITGHTFTGIPNLKVVFGGVSVQDGKTTGGALNQSILQLQIYDSSLPGGVATVTWTGAAAINALGSTTYTRAMPNNWAMTGSTTTQLVWTLYSRADKSTTSDHFNYVTINEIYFEG